MPKEFPPSRCRRFFRLWWVRSLLLAVVFVVVAYFVNNWRWEKKWTTYENSARARGVKIYLSEYDRSAGVPDAENFAATPLWKEVFAEDGKGSRATRLRSALQLAPKSSGKPKLGPRPPRKNLATSRASLALNKDSAKSDAAVTDAAAVLRGLEFLHPELDEIRDGLKRPQCVFPQNFATISDMRYSHFSVLQAAAKVLALRSCALLASGDLDGAIEDIGTMFELAGKLESEPTLIAGLVQSSMISIARQAISDGLDDGRWTESQLREIEALVARVNLIKRHIFSMESERAFGNSMLAKYIVDGTRYKDVPPGTPTELNWLIERYICGRSYVRSNQIWINAAFDEEISMWSPMKEQWNPSSRKYSVSELKLSWERYNFVHAILSWPIYETAGEQALEGHAKLLMTGLACALERYRISRGAYPETLDLLVPDFVASIPHDPCDGKPLRYRLEPNSYLLYSVGIDRKDDGGNLSTVEFVADPDWRWWAPLKE